MEKKVLSEIAIYHGDVKMPKGFEIDKISLVKDITLSHLYEDIEFPFSIPWDMLKTYITDHIRIKHGLNLVPKNTFGNFFQGNEISKPLLQINKNDLKNSPDFVLLYGVELDPKTCKINIHYDDNRRKGLIVPIELEINKFVMFPSTQLYYITNTGNSNLNYIQTINFEYI